MFNVFIRGEPPQIQDCEIGLKKLETSFYMVWCKAHFDILNYLGVTHSCDRQTDDRTDIII